MRKVESRRLKLGLSKTALAAELQTTTDALRAWMTGRTVGRKETVGKTRLSPNDSVFPRPDHPVGKRNRYSKPGSLIQYQKLVHVEHIAVKQKSVPLT
jgi:hypothetical protein